MSILSSRLNIKQKLQLQICNYNFCFKYNSALRKIMYFSLSIRRFNCDFTMYNIFTLIMDTKILYYAMLWGVETKDVIYLTNVYN